MFRTIKLNFFGRKIQKDAFGKCVCSGLDDTYQILLSECLKHSMKLNSKFATGDKWIPLHIQFSVAEDLWFFEKQELKLPALINIKFFSCFEYTRNCSVELCLLTCVHTSLADSTLRFVLIQQYRYWFSMRYCQNILVIAFDCFGVVSQVPLWQFHHFYGPLFYILRPLCWWTWQSSLCVLNET
jgi:hypothetical protein